ncbi:hypothetical protein MAPG_02497, partial [Magnaporthiopsis poae ATCC 64411]|uniref:Uncharacterized protein n=1 Tax=Magnaporthiopsis poae (strain ATCC 64411 / 73-15) TaxID=644358 RepID=A0A0C4DRI8_MAGP6
PRTWHIHRELADQSVCRNGRNAYYGRTDGGRECPLGRSQASAQAYLLPKPIHTLRWPLLIATCRNRPNKERNMRAQEKKRDVAGCFPLWVIMVVGGGAESFCLPSTLELVGTGANDGLPCRWRVCISTRQYIISHLVFIRGIHCLPVPAGPCFACSASSARAPLL